MSAESSSVLVNNKKTYACEVCFKTFTSRGLYTVHMAKHTRPHRCDTCGRGFAKRFTLLSHKKTHLGQKDHRCSLCGQAFTLRFQLSKHTIDLHPSDGPQCRECGEHFKNEKLLKLHETYFCKCTEHSNSVSHSCSDCGKMFLTPDELKSHLRTHQQQYHCSACDKKFGERSLLQTHILASHFNVRPYRCIVCDSSFTMKAHCERHCRLHLRQQASKCELCGIMFRFEQDYLLHTARNLCTGQMVDINTIDPRKLVTYEKPDFDKLGITRSMLGYQEKPSVNCVSMKADGQNDDPTDLKKVGKFSCSMCSISFKKSALLTVHQAQIHGIGSEPYRCYICGHGFAFDYAIRAHVESHLPHGNRRCNKCGTRFNSVRRHSTHKCGSDAQQTRELPAKNGSQLLSDESTLVCVKMECPNVADSSEKHNETVIQQAHSNRLSDNNDSTMSSDDTSNLYDQSSGLKPSHERLVCIIKKDLSESGYHVSSSIVSQQSEMLRTPLDVRVSENSPAEKILINGVFLSTWLDAAVEASRTTPRDSENSGRNFSGWCSVCEVTITSRYKYRVHMERHMNTRSYECPDCPKSFNTSEDLKAHQRWHDPTRFVTCPVCGTRCATASDLRKHQSVHDGSKPYECVMCGKKFRRHVYLVVHERTHTGETPYECDICGRRFRIRSSLDDHRKVHTGDKPFECRTCGKRFTQRGNWRTHERRHDGGQKAFSCEKCAKRFVQNYELQNHRLRCVVDDFPFICLLCGMRFIKEHPLQRHLNRHSCSVCGQQFVVMKEKVTHQLRCRRDAATKVTPSDD